MGMAAIGVALYKYVMKFSPKNGNYFNRDRFVLSNGKSRPLEDAFGKQAIHVQWTKTDQP
jgi:transketolase